MGCLKLTYREELPTLRVVKSFSFSEEKSSTGVYRYGFNGMEKDDEVKGSGNSYTTYFRQIDTRLGRWMSVDPVDHIDMSPYCTFMNNPVYFLDPSGAASKGPGPGKGRRKRSKNKRAKYKRSHGTVGSKRKHDKIANRDKTGAGGATPGRGGSSSSSASSQVFYSSLNRGRRPLYFSLKPWGNLNFKLFGYSFTSRQHRGTTGRLFPFHTEKLFNFDKTHDFGLSMGFRFNNLVWFNLKLGRTGQFEYLFPQYNVFGKSINRRFYIRFFYRVKPSDISFLPPRYFWSSGDPHEFSGGKSWRWYCIEGSAVTMLRTGLPVLPRQNESLIEDMKNSIQMLLHGLRAKRRYNWF